MRILIKSAKIVDRNSNHNGETKDILVEEGIIKEIEDNISADNIDKIIELYKPDLISMEETFININAGSSLKLGYVRGALMAVIGRSTLPFYEYAPNKIKKSIVGVGHADKEQVKHMVQTIISGSNSDMSFDESDALAAAYTCLVNYKS